jgi:hypothetical protein
LIAAIVTSGERSPVRTRSVSDSSAVSTNVSANVSHFGIATVGL